MGFVAHPMALRYAGAACDGDNVRRARGRRFLELWRQAAAGELSSWETTDEGALALVIILDQFPRNMFRGDIRTYSSDALAREVASRAIARGAGIAESHWVRDEAHFDRLTSRRFEEGGPVLLAAKIDVAPGTGPTVRDPPLIRHRFMRGLGTGRASALDA